jgi:hypothetical protein
MRVLNLILYSLHSSAALSAVNLDFINPDLSQPEQCARKANLPMTNGDNHATGNLPAS